MRVHHNKNLGVWFSQSLNRIAFCIHTVVCVFPPFLSRVFLWNNDKTDSKFLSFIALTMVSLKNLSPKNEKNISIFQIHVTTRQCWPKCKLRRSWGLLFLSTCTCTTKKMKNTFNVFTFASFQFCFNPFCLTL